MPLKVIYLQIGLLIDNLTPVLLLELRDLVFADILGCTHERLVVYCETKMMVN